MPKHAAVQNSFIGGLKTEFTGLNFPENACTNVDNCVFSIIGDVLRREGINFEANNVLQGINTSGQAISYYRWKNAGGDGETEILVLQVGDTLYFFQSSASTVTAPLSTTLLTGTINLPDFLALGSSNDPSTIECQYSDGNGFLFVYHPYLEPFYCTYTSTGINAAAINVQVRDFNGVQDGLGVTTRPNTLSTEHNYNLQNQGWGSSSTAWAGTSINAPPTTAGLFESLFWIQKIVAGTGSPNVPEIWSINATINTPSNVVVGGNVIITGTVSTSFHDTKGSLITSNATGTMTGTVTTYPGSGSAITITLSSVTFTYTNNSRGSFNGYFTADSSSSSGNAIFNWTIVPAGVAPGNQIPTWHSALNDYPSNADIWWLYKDTTGVFNPATTIANVTAPSSPAPQGHFIVNAFNQQFTQVSGVNGITSITTSVRPQTGCWFQGRVFYSGVNASQPPTGDQTFYTWTENIYFSQIIDSYSNPQFGLCYQTNDPTDENFFDILPTDGGVITIQGSGNIYKLFPIQNGLLVFASNGIWFITGSQGIGFAATDYTITKISSIQTISSYSFVRVNNLPIFWNEEGIYMIEPGQQGGLNVSPLTVGTILSFYNNIPLDSKKYVRGDYDPVSYVIQWVYRSTEESGISNRYQFDSALSLNVINKAFYPYTFGNNGNCYINGIVYMNYPSGSVTSGTAPNPSFKYLTSVGTNFTFSEENDGTNWLDYYSFDNVGVNYTSFFETGYSLAGKAIQKWQPLIVEMFSRGANQYTIQGIFDYATSGNSGRYSTVQLVTNPNIVTYASGIGSPDLIDYQMYYRRHKLRGHGMSVQIQVSSVQGQPFDIMGWGILQDVDEGI